MHSSTVLLTVYLKISEYTAQKITQIWNELQQLGLSCAGYITGLRESFLGVKSVVIFSCLLILIMLFSFP